MPCLKQCKVQKLIIGYSRSFKNKMLTFVEVHKKKVVVSVLQDQCVGDIGVRVKEFQVMARSEVGGPGKQASLRPPGPGRVAGIGVRVKELQVMARSEVGGITASRRGSDLTDTAPENCCCRVHRTSLC